MPEDWDLRLYEDYVERRSLNRCFARSSQNLASLDKCLSWVGHQLALVKLQAVSASSPNIQIQLSALVVSASIIQGSRDSILILLHGVSSGCEGLVLYSANFEG